MRGEDESHLLSSHRHCCCQRTRSCVSLMNALECRCTNVLIDKLSHALSCRLSCCCLSTCSGQATGKKEDRTDEREKRTKGGNVFSLFLLLLLVLPFQVRRCTAGHVSPAPEKEDGEKRRRQQGHRLDTKLQLPLLRDSPQ